MEDREDVLKPAVGASGLVYLKGEGEGGLHVLSSPNCPRACHDSQTEDRRGKNTPAQCVLDYRGVSFASHSQDRSFDGGRKWINKMQPGRNTANYNATVGMQCCMQFCRRPVDGNKSLENSFFVWWDALNVKTGQSVAAKAG